eukprot:c9755_g1_i1.p1 GENE.c9755_g1_i1~~c9755_g1_i1.p1  ORF type:complete len:650 (+),score=170.40 c9755_g1_i1:170-2119(+)
MSSTLRPFEQLWFSDAEQIFYSRVYDATKLEEDVVKGAKAMGILKTSGLSNNQLAQVWDLADRGKKGHLTKKELFVMLRGVALIQRRNAVPTSIALEVELGIDELPSFENIPPATMPEVEEAMRNRVSAASLSGDVDPKFCVKLTDAQKIRSHVEYVITVHCELGLLDNNSSEVVVQKRFSDFDKFRQQLVLEAPGALIPLLPPKTPPNKWFGRKSGTFNDDFLADRKNRLEALLNRILSDTHLRATKTVLAFIQDKEVKGAPATGVEGSASSGSAGIKSALLALASKTTKADNRFEEYSLKIDRLEKSLVDVLKKFEEILSTHLETVQSLEAFLVVVLPPCLPLSLEETSSHFQFIREKANEHVTQAQSSIHLIRDLLPETKAMKQALQAAAVAQKQFETVINDPKTTDATTIAQKASASKRVLEEQILQFDMRCKEHISRFFKQIVTTKRALMRVEAEWWEALLKRVLFAEHAQLAARVDVPRCIMAHQELTWLPEGVGFDPYKDVIEKVKFEVGQASDVTVTPMLASQIFNSPNHANSNYNTTLNAPAVPVPTSSFGHTIDDELAPSNPTLAPKQQQQQKKQLPAYAFADGSSQFVESQSHRERESDIVEQLDDLNKDLGLAWDALDTKRGSQSLPGHWVGGGDAN